MRFCFLLVFFLFGNVDVNAQSVPFQFDALKKLEGKWLMASKMTFGETWSYYSDELLIGEGWMLNAHGDTVFTESLRIVKMGNDIVYIAKPKGKAAVAFTLVEVTLNNEWVFENREHDSPQRIVYQIHGFDGLDAWIGDFNKKKVFVQKAKFHFTRIE